MGVAFFPVFEKAADGFEIAFCGKMLAKISDAAVRERAAILGVKPLMDFFGFDPAVLTADFDIETDEALAEKWFAPEDGLATVAALINDMTENPKPYSAFSDSDGLIVTERLAKEMNEKILAGAIEDLKVLHGILSEAKNRQVRWYLAIDF